jgi:lipid A ethanolaminephosphotransferase
MNRRSVRGFSPQTVALVAALFLALPMNLVFWQHLAEIVSPLDARGVKTMALFALIVSSFFLAVLSVVSSARLIKPVLTLLFLPTAAVAYFMNQYGIMIDAEMVANVIETDVAEAADLLTWKLAAYLLFLGALPVWLLWRLPLRSQGTWRGLAVGGGLFVAAAAVCVGTVFVSYQELASVFRNHRELRLVLAPTNYLHAVSSYWRHRNEVPAGPVEIIGADAHRRVNTAQRPPQLLVLVVGETARADRMSINGYEQATTPELAALKGLINFPSMQSCGTATAVSLPCMFSNLGRAGYSEARASNREGLLDVVQRAGVDVLWLDNNSGCKGACARVPTLDLSRGDDPALCRDRECFDEVLVRELSARLAHIDRDTVIVLHQKGSHGPAYYQRYPKAFERFKPACQTAQIDRCSQHEISNAYDNTIAYTDHVLAQVIKRLEASEPRLSPAMLYLSDHGESLGEGGVYLHGAPYILAPAAQTHVPALFWSSKGFRQSVRLDVACLSSSAKTATSHDNLFHTVLGVMGVETQVYHKDLDVTAACRGGANET